MTSNAKPHRKPVVALDTSVLMARASPWELEELKALGAVNYLVPATTVSELDLLMSRAETRTRARSALNVLKQLVERGAAKDYVSCGNGSSVRIARSDEAVAVEGLDLALADDRILATCLSQVAELRYVATTEFALYAKAILYGVDGMLLDGYGTVIQTVTLREKEAFRQHWARVVSADTIWKISRRGLNFVSLPLVTRIIEPVRGSGEPAYVADLVGKFDRLRKQWVSDVDVSTLMKPIFGMDPPHQVDYRVLTFPVAPARFKYGQPHDEGPPGWVPAQTRPESAEERAIRIRRSEQYALEREAFIVDELFAALEIIRQYVLDQTGDELL